MKKIIILLVLVLLGCQTNSGSDYTDNEQKQLEKLGVLDIVSNDCENSKSVQIMLKADFKKENAKRYCELKIEKDNGVNTFIEKGLKNKEIQAYLDLKNVRSENIDRYIAYSVKDIKQKVLDVNMNLDLKPYSKINIIEGENIEMLVNKYNALPANYIPSDLVDISAVCTQGVDFSCADIDQQQLRKEAADGFASFVAKAKKEMGIDIIAIASYRSYAYQQNLYNYNLETSGLEYADTYYARPGQSEHNSGLAVDITFNNHPFNEIEQYEEYTWIKENMHKYGFILRYPADKEDKTQYGYESWHLRYVGKTLATYLYEHNLTLDEYYGLKEE